MSRLSHTSRRLRILAIAWVLAISVITPAILNRKVGAATTQFTSRSIMMSTSATSAAATSYNVQFTQSSGTVKGVVIEFCSNSPIVGDSSCTAPTTLNVGTPTITYTTGLTTGYTLTAPSANVIKMTKAAGDAGVTAVNITITSMTNPSALGTFYARIVTFANDSGADSPATWTTTAPGTNYQYGGVALSTANQIVVTAKVQETLTFCAFTTGTACSGASGTAVALGDANGVLSNLTAGYTNTSKVSLATNAQSGAVVKATAATLTSGANTITAVTGTTCTADSTTSTVAYFGIRVSATGAGQTAAGNWGCTSGNHLFDTTTSTNNLSYLYGATILNTGGAPIDESASTIEYAAKAASTTKAGIYTSTFTYIATGTY